MKISSKVIFGIVFSFCPVGKKNNQVAQYKVCFHLTYKILLLFSLSPETFLLPYIIAMDFFVALCGKLSLHQPDSLR